MRSLTATMRAGLLATAAALAVPMAASRRPAAAAPPRRAVTSPAPWPTVPPGSRTFPRSGTGRCSCTATDSARCPRRTPPTRRRPPRCWPAATRWPARPMTRTARCGHWTARSATSSRPCRAVETSVLPGRPRQVLAFGTSMGGLISALEAQDGAGRIDGALTTCGIVAGAINLNNYQLDGEYALAQLLLPGQQVQLVRFTGTGQALGHGRDPAGRRRAGAADRRPGGPGWRSRWRSSTCPRGTPARPPRRRQRPGRAGSRPVPGGVHRRVQHPRLHRERAARHRPGRGRQRDLDQRRGLRRRAGPLPLPAGGRRALPGGRAQPGRRPGHADAGTRTSRPTPARSAR